jgi:hypothetical protein
MLAFLCFTFLPTHIGVHVVSGSSIQDFLSPTGAGTYVKLRIRIHVLEVQIPLSRVFFLMCVKSQQRNSLNS